MAIDAHSTTAPAVQPGLLRTWAGAVPVPTPALTAETVALLDEVFAEIGENPNLAAAAEVFSDPGNNPEDVLHGEAPICSAADLPCGVASDVRHGGAGDAARALHMRRALEGAIAHGMALMDALGLPQLVERNFASFQINDLSEDRSVIGEAVDHAIVILDALDAPDVDLEDEGEAEPWLGWIDGKPVLSDSHDDREAEDDDEPILGAPERHPSCYQFALCDATSSQEQWADGSARHDEAEAVNEDGGDILDEGEETLGWAANVGQLALGPTTADGDETALERHGRGFLRSGPDDAEDDDPLFWSVDVGCAIGATVDRDGAHV